jgi:hypothetical protein
MIGLKQLAALLWLGWSERFSAWRAEMLAERLEAIAKTITDPTEGLADLDCRKGLQLRLMVIAAEVRATLDSYEQSYLSLNRRVAEQRDRLAVLEASEQARLSARAYSASPTGYGMLRSPYIPGPECDEDENIA